jgi:hypothetical protein
MPHKRFALSRNGPKEIELRWGLGWKNFTVHHHGNVIGTVSKQSELIEGRSFSLPDGSALSVKLKTGIGHAGLEVLHNGKPIPGSDADPVQKIKTAFGILLFLAITNMLGGILIFSLFAEFQVAGILIMVFGLLFAGLAIAVKKRSLAALIVAIILLVIDIISGIIFQSMSQNNISIVWILLRVLFLIYLLQAINPMKELKRISTS